MRFASSSILRSSLSQGKTLHVLDDGRVGARHECGGFFMPNLNEPDLIGALSQRLHDSVDAVARQSEHDLDAPVVERVDEKYQRLWFSSGIQRGSDTPPNA